MQKEFKKLNQQKKHILGFADLKEKLKVFYLEFSGYFSSAFFAESGQSHLYKHDNKPQQQSNFIYSCLPLARRAQRHLYLDNNKRHLKVKV